MALNPKSETLHPKTLNPKTLNPKTLNPKTLNPKTLNPEEALAEARPRSFSVPGPLYRGRTRGQTPAAEGRDSGPRV